MSLILDGARLARLFPFDVAAEEAAPDIAHVEALHDEERAQIARAVDKRRAEYATARMLARRAMERLGAIPAPVVNAEDRAPLWPAGIIGSITHTKGYCGVVLARASDVRSIGIDVERDEPAREELFEKICTERELAWITAAARDDAAERGRLVKRVFSAKEAFYKAQYPLTRQYLGFHDVELELDVDACSFALTLRRHAGGFTRGMAFSGRIAIEDGLVTTALAAQ